MFFRLRCRAGDWESYWQIILIVAIDVAFSEASAASLAYVQEITESDTALFGADVHSGKLAAGGPNLIVGGIRQLGSFGPQWGAHTFELRPAGTWGPSNLLAQTVVGTGSAPITQAVAIEGTSVVVGTQYDDPNGIYSGSAQVLRRHNGNWLAMPKLTPTDGAQFDFFGNAVAISGDRVLVGAPGVGGTFGGVGAGYIFELDANNQWTQTAKLAPIGGVEGDEAGRAVALIGSNATIGSPSDDGIGENSGTVHVFKHSAVGWSESEEIHPSDPARGALFGYAIASSQSYLLIGAPGNLYSTTPDTAGAAYLFCESENGLLTEVVKFVPSLAIDYGFGKSVAISESIAVVGASGKLGSSDGGAAYVFRRNDDGHWKEIARLSSHQDDALERFGMGVATNGTHVFVAAQQYSESGAVKGKVYVYAIPEPTSLSMFVFASLVIAQNRSTADRQRKSMA